MNIEKMTDRTIELWRQFFAALNEGDQDVVSSLLFQPDGQSTEPLQRYVAAMVDLAPFELISVEVREVLPPKSNQHGTLVSIRTTVKFRSEKTSERCERAPVWWFPDTDELLIAVRWLNLTTG